MLKLSASEQPTTTLVQFAGASDGRLQYSIDIWEGKKADIRQLYLDEGKSLQDVMRIMQERGFNASMKMYKSRFKSWGWKKNKQRKAVVARVNAVRQVPSIPAPILSPIFQFQVILVSQMGQYFETDLREVAWLGGPGQYYDSDPGRSISDIIQGSLLVQRNFPEGFHLINRGFANIHKVLQEQTLYGLMDMLLHLHVYCPEKIIRLVWHHLCSWSDKVCQKTHRFHPSLEQLRSLFAAKSVSYTEIILQTQIQVYEEFRRRRAQKDPCLLSMMSNGVAPLLSSSPWKDSDWKDFLVTSLDEMRSSMRSAYGVDNINYHVWLRKHLGSVRNLYGEDSDEAFALAEAICKEMEGIKCEHARLQHECWITMAQYHWRQSESALDACNPRATLAISFLEKYTEGSRAVGLKNDLQLSFLQTLETWQRSVGYDADADITAVRCSQMLKEISDIPNL